MRFKYLLWRKISRRMALRKGCLSFKGVTSYANFACRKVISPNNICHMHMAAPNLGPIWMAADSYLYKDKPIFFGLLLSVKRYYDFCRKRLQFLTKFCQQRYGYLKKVTSALDHRQKGSTRGQFYCLQNNAILLPTKQHNFTAYKTTQFYCPQNNTILLPTKQHNSTA